MSAQTVADPAVEPEQLTTPDPKPAKRAKGSRKTAAPKAKAKAPSQAQILAARAQEMATTAGLKSRYLPGEAQHVLAFKIQEQTGGLWVKAPGKDGVEHVLSVPKLRALAAKGKVDKEQATQLRELVAGTPGQRALYARKLATFLLAASVEKGDAS